MALSNAERQARKRDKQSSDLKALRKEISRLCKLVELVAKKVVDPEPVHNGSH